MKTLWKFIIPIIFLLYVQMANAGTLAIPMHLVGPSNTGKAIGIITARDTAKGLLLTPDLYNLPPGAHGFHVHQHPSCADDGNAAGDHLDPKHTGKHLGPYNDQGHLGDLPRLIVNAKGMATKPVLAPRVTTKDLLGHALIIHAGGDNYSDVPEKLGGGGKRIACGVVYKAGIHNKP